MEAFFENGDLNVRDLEVIAKDMKTWEVNIANRDRISFKAGERIYRELQQILAQGFNEQRTLKQLNKTMEVIQKMGLEINLWKSQNLYFSMLKTYKKLPESKRSSKWEKHFYRLGDYLGMRTPALVTA
ncbi:MAG: hypothetical protein AAF705_12120 [Bacteroidota bacterium]